MLLFGMGGVCDVGLLVRDLSQKEIGVSNHNESLMGISNRYARSRESLKGTWSRSSDLSFLRERRET